jgi:hypoxanthine phosphoribosyltransferase
MKRVSVNGTDYLRLYWSDIEEMIPLLGDKIEKYFTPSLLIGIQRGGVIVANLLSDYLNVQNVLTIGVKSYKKVCKKGRLNIYQHLNMKNLKKYDVLLVDDVSDSGSTLKYVLKNEIKPKNPKSLYTASLFIKPKSRFVPSFYLYETSDWIIFPWETMETAKDILEKLLEKYFTKTSKDMIADLDFSEKEIEKSLRLLR